MRIKNSAMLCVVFGLMFFSVSFIGAEGGAACQDSDDGLDYYEKGTISSSLVRGDDGVIRNFTQGTTDDFCWTSRSEFSVNGPKVFEYYCGDDGAIWSEIYECSNGCVDGACVERTAFETCLDSDKGLSYYEKGVVTYRNDSKTDYCSDFRGYNLIEHHCTSNADDSFDIVWSGYECPNGCVDGACVEGDVDEEDAEEGVSFDYAHLFPDEYLILDGVDDSFFVDAGIRNNYPEKIEDVVIEMSIPDLGLSQKQNIGSIKGNWNALPDQFGIDVPEDIEGGRYNININVYYTINGQKMTLSRPFEREISSGNDIQCIDEGHDNYKVEKIIITFPSGFQKEMEDVCRGPETLYEYDCSDDGWNMEAFICPMGCANGRCEGEIIDVVNNKENVQEIPKVNKEKGIVYVCGGCEIEAKCYPIGHRKDGEYCSDGLEFRIQVNDNNFCENGFECSSNLCIDDRCVAPGIWRKFMEWLNKLFG